MKSRRYTPSSITHTPTHTPLFAVKPFLETRASATATATASTFEKALRFSFVEPGRFAPSRKFLRNVPGGVFYGVIRFSQ